MMSPPSKLPVRPRKVFSLKSWSSARNSNDQGWRAVGVARHLGRDGPAGEGAGALEDVGFGVVADAEGEEFEQFAAPVFVGGVLVVLVVVQPEDHGGVAGELDEQVSVVAHAVFAEHANLLYHVVAVVHLAVAGGEHLVPEDRHLLFERPLGVEQVVEPVGLSRAYRAAGHLGDGVVSEQGVLVRGGMGVLVEQFLDGRLVSLFGARLYLFAGCAEAGAPHEMGHKGDVFIGGHRSVLLSGLRGVAAVSR